MKKHNRIFNITEYLGKSSLIGGVNAVVRTRSKPTKRKRLKTLDTDPRLEEGRHGSREKGFESHVE